MTEHTPCYSCGDHVKPILNCPNCGQIFPVAYVKVNKPNYCYVCGARIREVFNNWLEAFDRAGNLTCN